MYLLLKRLNQSLATLTALGLVGCVALGLTGCSLDRSSDKLSTAPSTSAPRAHTIEPTGPEGGLGAVLTTPIKLGPPERPRDWRHARLQAARRLVLANPDITYTGNPPDILLAIPVLTIELHGDGSVRNITVMRYPGQARDTVQKAIAAVRKAAPYGDVSKLPKPWKFNETFLFNEYRKFKPMTLDRL